MSHFKFYSAEHKLDHFEKAVKIKQLVLCGS
ncbi:DUF6500 family protein [Acinetobacter pittii]